MKCSIVILNWNGAEMMRRYLPSVLNFCPDFAEVVVADNGSTDNSVGLLKEQFTAVRLIQLDKNYGFAEGYNLALHQINSEYIVLLNSDVEVTAGWLEPLIYYMDEHPETAAVQPKILAHYDKVKKKTAEPVLFEHAGAAGGYIDRLGYPYCRGRIMGELELDHGQYDSPARIFWASGACLLTRTALYKEIDGLDADFFAHMEEIDFCWRLNSRGYQLICLPCSTVYHLGGGALPYESPHKTYLNFRNCLLMLYKNLPAVTLAWVMLLRFFLDYIAVLQYVVKGQTANAREVVHARIDYHKMRPGMQEKRRTNLQQSKIHTPTTIGLFSILIHYYVLGHKHFSQLH